jgi:tripartite-type tricarboxylate transporter receptor subunit TctC
VKIVVPFAPGGSNDVFARALAEQLSDDMKVTFLVENRPGAGGATGSAQVSKSAPDGATLLLTSNSITTNNALQAKPPFDVATSFTHLAILNKGPSLVIVNNNSKYNDLPSLFDAMKKGAVKNYGSAGIGTNAHLAGEMLNFGLKTEVTHVPYKGIAAIANDIIGNEIDFVITTSASVSGQLKGGYLKAIGVTSPEVSPFFKDLKPVADFIPKYEVESWWGVFAPPRMPAPLADFLNRKINEMTRKPRMAELFKNESTMAVNMDVDQARRFVAAEKEKWVAVAKSRKIEPI